MPKEENLIEGSVAEHPLSQQLSPDTKGEGNPLRDSKNSKGSKVVDFALDEQPRSGAPETPKEEAKAEVKAVDQVMKKLDPEKAKSELLDAHGK